MATDGPTPPPCDLDILKRGSVVFVGDTLPSNAMERWVKRVAELSGQRVDWHFLGGYARVLALGDLHRVEVAIKALLPEYNQKRNEILRKMGL